MTQYYYYYYYYMIYIAPISKVNSRPFDCIAAHYKIVPIKIVDKLVIKICMCVCFILLVV